jgi:hypothetical protein
VYNPIVNSILLDSTELTNEELDEIEVSINHSAHAVAQLIDTDLEGARPHIRYMIRCQRRIERSLKAKVTYEAI